MTLEESVIGGCLLDHHCPINSNSSSLQPDLPCSYTMADAQKIPTEEPNVNVR